MLKDRLIAHRVRTFSGLALACLLVIVLLPARLVSPITAQQGTVLTPDIPVVPPGSAYRQTNLLSDIGGFASVQDPLLVNPWGISLTSSSPFWVANNGPSVTQLLRGDVSNSPFVLNPSPQTV